MLGIQEHRIMHDETVKYNTIGHSTLITTLAWQNYQGASTGGIGIKLNKRSINSLSRLYHTLREY